MKIGNPLTRNALNLKKFSNILDIGGGHNPHPKANVVVEKYVNNNDHRGQDCKIFKHQTLIEADGENLPFKDKEFDYVISCHVLEHVDNPESFLKEQCRVANKGYIETPSLIGEFIHPKKSHKWVILEIDNKLILYSKNIVFKNNKMNIFSDIFMYYLSKQSFAYKIFKKTHPNIFTVRYEWKDIIEYEINPTNTKYEKYFFKSWDNMMFNTIVKPKKMFFELISSVYYTSTVIINVLYNKLKTLIRT